MRPSISCIHPGGDSSLKYDGCDLSSETQETTEVVGEAARIPSDTMVQTMVMRWYHLIRYLVRGGCVQNVKRACFRGE